MAQKLQNSEIPEKNEGSGARIVKNQRKMKVLASCCWAKKRLSRGLNNRPTELKNSEKNVKNPCLFFIVYLHSKRLDDPDSRLAKIDNWPKLTVGQVAKQRHT